MTRAGAPSGGAASGRGLGRPAGASPRTTSAPSHPRTVEEFEALSAEIAHREAVEQGFPAVIEDPLEYEWLAELFARSEKKQGKAA